MKLKLLAGLLFLAPVLIYVVQNGGSVSIHFLRWEYAVSQALLLLSTLLAGVILGLFLSSAWRNKEKNKQKKVEKKARKLKKTEEKEQKKQAKQQESEEKKGVEPQPEGHKDNLD